MADLIKETVSDARFKKLTQRCEGLVRIMFSWTALRAWSDFLPSTVAEPAGCRVLLRHRELFGLEPWTDKDADDTLIISRR